jgi:virginiamycin A acetyltransferase
MSTHRFITSLAVGLRTLRYLPHGILYTLGPPAKHLLKGVLVGAFFRAKAVRVYSPHVSLRADLHKGVVIGAGVVVAPGVTIGDYSYVNHDAIIESGQLGKFCSIGARASIGPFEHPVNSYTTHPIAYNGTMWGLNAPQTPGRVKAPPQIGNDVWIGRDAFVLRGVQVGDGAIIGANAVVTHDVPNYAVVAGVPATIRGRRFGPDEASRILETRWWDQPTNIRSLLSFEFLHD